MGSGVTVFPEVVRNSSFYHRYTRDNHIQFHMGVNSLYTPTQLAKLCGKAVKVVWQACHTGALVPVYKKKRINLLSQQAIKYILLSGAQIPEDVRNCPAYTEIMQENPKLALIKPGKIYSHRKSKNKKALIEKGSTSVSSTKQTDENNGVQDLEGYKKRYKHVAHMLFYEVIDRFGTDKQFVEWMRGQKMAQEIHEKQLKIQIIRKDLISRKMVEKYTLTHYEEAYSRLVTDAPRSMAVQLIELMATDPKKEDLEDLIRREISNTIKNIKLSTKKSLAENIEEDGFKLLESTAA